MKRFSLIKLSAVVLVSWMLFSPVPAQAKTVNSGDGNPIAYDVQGKGDIALVLVHCWCCNKGFWDAQVPYFSKKYKVVTIDLPGHGESGKKRAAWTMKAYGEDVAIVVNQLKLKRMILVGHSMGGPVIAYAAGLLKDKVIGLIGVDTFINVEAKYPKEQFEQFLAPFRGDFPAGVKIFMKYMFLPNADPAVKNRVIDTLSSAKKEVGVGTMEEILKIDLAKVVKDANVHIRCINSEMFRTQNNIEANKRHARSFEVKFMKDVGHFLHMENPEAFNPLMEEAINELLEL
ncbi:MAG: alpha/beta hydrolase [bacterium]|nr:alpha/beta hydrolase [bacterium]